MILFSHFFPYCLSSRCIVSFGWMFSVPQLQAHDLFSFFFVCKLTLSFLVHAFGFFLRSCCRSTRFVMKVQISNDCDRGEQNEKVMTTIKGTVPPLPPTPRLTHN